MPARNKLRGMSEHGLTIHLFGTCSRVSKHRTLPGMILTPENCSPFLPRRDHWAEHFVWDGSTMTARTQIGRVTVAVLAINRIRTAAALEAVVMGKPRIKPNYRRRVLRLPDLDHGKTAVLNSLGSPASRRVYEYAIDP